MIRKFTFGTPFNTGAVVRPEIAEEESASKLPFLTIVQNKVASRDDAGEDDSVIFSYRLPDEALVYGLGEQARGLNKRGWRYESRNTDNPFQNEGRTALYSSHNFLIIDGEERFGLFLDTPGYVEYDIGFTNYDELKITVKDGGFDLYLIEETSLTGICRALRRLTGASYVPPKWAFGFGMSRWDHKDADEIREVADRYRALDMPIDMMYLDIPYMDDYMDFTVSEERYPQFREFNAELAKKNIHLVPIVDAGIKKKEGYPVYEEGREKGYFCTKEDGSEFVVGVWPGASVFPDALNPEAAHWFGLQYKAYLDTGVEGFWNDMNEPSIFYTEDALQAAFRKVAEYEGENLDAETFFEMRDVMGGISNKTAYYKDFYHNVNGKKVRHDRVHNLYGSALTSAAGEALRELSPDRRTLLFSRSSMIGMHRNAGIWYGDNSSMFSHILMNLKEEMNANMVGFLYSGADTAGFGDQATPDIALRWLELGIFSPLLRNHSSRRLRRQEFYLFGMDEAFRGMLKLRYALIPYLYSEFMKAALRDEMLFQPLAFVYEDDERAKHIEDQAMVGEAVMIAPVYEQNAVGRYVYVPEKMRLFRFRSPEDYDTEYVEKGDYFIHVALDEVLLFVREGHALPFADTKGVLSTADLDYGKLKALKYDEAPVEYELYNDDGVTREIGEEKIRKIVL